MKVAKYGVDLVQRVTGVPSDHYRMRVQKYALPHTSSAAGHFKEIEEKGYAAMVAREKYMHSPEEIDELAERLGPILVEQVVAGLQQAIQASAPAAPPAPAPVDNMPADAAVDEEEDEAVAEAGKALASEYRKQGKRVRWADVQSEARALYRAGKISRKPAPAVRASQIPGDRIGQYFSATCAAQDLAAKYRAEGRKNVTFDACLREVRAARGLVPLAH